MAFGDEPIPPSERPPLTLDDRCLYIYTSGTTGLPKAANINHYRVLAAMLAFSAVMEANGERPHLRLPAALPHRPAACVAHRRGADRRRLGLHPREVLGAAVLGRRRRPRLHPLPVYRRALPLPRQCAAAPQGERSTAPPLLRQRAAPRHLAGVQGALRHPAYPRVLCRDRGQRDPLQFRRHARRRRPRPGWARRIFPITIVRFDIEREEPVRGDGRALHRMRPRRNRRGRFEDHHRPAEARAAFRRLCRQGGDREEDPSRRLRAGRHAGSAPAT